MASALEVFLQKNRIASDVHIAVDRNCLGWVGENGFNLAPAPEVEMFHPQNLMYPGGGDIMRMGGQVTIQQLEVLTTQIARIFDLEAGSSIAAPLAGDRWSLQPLLRRTARQIEAWAEFTSVEASNDYNKSSRFFYVVIKGILQGMPNIPMSKNAPLIPELVFSLVQLNTAWPGGMLDIYDAVAGDVTVTPSAPADEASDVAITATPTFTFSKPMAMTALADDFWSFTKDEDSSEVAFTPAFGTRTLDGLTLTDPTKIILTPSSSLENSKAYTITLSQQVRAVDWTHPAAQTEVNFDTVAP